MKISIIIPAYNEEKRIGKTLEAYSDFFERKRKEGELDYEILVVINNTTDRTEEIVKEAQRKNKRIIYLNFEQGGKGFAVIGGFKDALKRKNELIGFVDADMATSPEEYFKLIENRGNYDGVIASRYMKGAKITPKPTLQRLIAKWMFNALVRSLLFIPYRDTQCGAKIFGRKVLVKVISRITMSNWAFDVDLLYCMKKEGFKITEVPTVWSDKKYSKINFWGAGPKMALGVVRLRLLNSSFRRLIKIYDLFFITKKTNGNKKN